jgi:phospholipid/cholesterol/gamma-HCH transport system substrate-binding protein
MANPVLVGATTVLVVVVAIFLAYQANEGLPFVPTRNLTVDLPDAQNLVQQNDVREGGHRIGMITKIAPVRLGGGKIGARLSLKLDRDVPAVPVDSTWAVRPRSALSLKYLELHRGHSRRTVPANGRVAAGQARSPVELDQLLDTFDRRTRAGQRKLVRGSAEALYGRGADINRAIGTLPPFLAHLTPVAHVLAEPSTGLRAFIENLDAGVRVLAPVGEQWAQSFADGATTFAAISRDPRALDRTIAETPPTLAVGEHSLRSSRPFLRDLAGYSQDLERVSRQVRLALPPINHALGVGTPVEQASPPLSDRAEEVLRTLGDVTRDPLTLTALRALTATADSLNPQLRFIGPQITVCNSWNLFWTFAGEHISERDPTGTSQRTISINGDHQDNDVSDQGAVQPVNGEHVAPNGIKQYFHGQPFGRAVDEKGNADCEDGQRGFPSSLPPSKFATPEQAQRFGHVISPATPRTPGDQGPYYDHFDHGKPVGLGPARVPPGETFTAEPQTGEQLP